MPELKRTPLAPLALLLALTLTSCRTASPQTASPSPPSATPVPATSPPSTATATPSPSLSPTRTPLSSFQFQRLVQFEHAGFSYPRFSGYPETYRPGLVVIASQDEEVLIGLAGGRENTGLSLADQLQGFLDFEATNIEIFTPTEPTSLEVNGLPAMSADFSGSLFGDTVAGRITYVIPLPGHFFVIFGNAPPERWHFEGLPLYLAILESVEFMEASLLPEGCPVSVDPTYAYSPDNPIRAGEGDAFSGPSLERAYLDSLAGPNGEPVTYERLGSQPQGETILDIYQVSFGHQSVSLYLDEYSGEPFRVPKGFSCRQ